MTNVEEARFALTEKPLKATSINRIKILHKLKNKYTHLLQPLRVIAAVRNAAGDDQLFVCLDPAERLDQVVLPLFRHDATQVEDVAILFQSV